MSEHVNITGSCLCGEVTYVCREPLFDLCFCHCSICRKLTGSGGGAYGSVNRNQFEWSTGEAILEHFAPTKLTRRYFCSSCGAYLLTEHDLEPHYVFVSLGTVDSEVTTRPEYRQYTAGAPEWLMFDDDLPKFPKWPNHEV